MGYDILKNLIDDGYPGRIYPINPAAPEILGLKAYPSVLEVPGSIDLALVEEGIELGKKMMAEMIATYSPPTSTTVKHNLNEVSPITARAPGEM